MTPADPIIAEVTASFAAEEFLGGKPGVEPNPLIIAVGTIAEKAVRSPLLHQRLERVQQVDLLERLLLSDDGRACRDVGEFPDAHSEVRRVVRDGLP